MAERVLASLLDVFKYSCYTDGIRRGHNIPTMGCSGFPDVGLSYFVHIVQIHIANLEQTGARSVSSAAMRRIPSCPAFIFPPSETASLSNTSYAKRAVRRVLPLSGTTSLSNDAMRAAVSVGVLPLSGLHHSQTGIHDHVQLLRSGSYFFCLFFLLPYFLISFLFYNSLYSEASYHKKILIFLRSAKRRFSLSAEICFSAGNFPLR